MPLQHALNMSLLLLRLCSGMVAAFCMRTIPAGLESIVVLLGNFTESLQKKSLF